VRHSRYTFEFMEQYDTFTLSAFPPEYQEALSLLGNRSGRNGDKISTSGLTPQASSLVAAPCFQEAELVIECRKMYWNDLNPVHFLDEAIYEKYPNRDFHRIYYGEVLKIFATDHYIR
jgi:flavin reductase (DIM6/NTAB) family NADH-FMN oxidoreductase RutF